MLEELQKEVLAATKKLQCQDEKIERKSMRAGAGDAIFKRNSGGIAKKGCQKEGIPDLAEEKRDVNFFLRRPFHNKNLGHLRGGTLWKKVPESKSLRKLGVGAPQALFRKVPSISGTQAAPRQESDS